jgi:hypothetical protein
MRGAVVSALMFAGAVIVAPPVSVGASGPQSATAATLPAKLSDAEFWQITSDISEPGGYFRIADNFTSNEGEVGTLMTELKGKGLTGGVYIGVGPEQNFSYMAAIKPAMAFIIDIRRQAVMQHLMFKAMFELSKDRADFLSMLFAKPRPDGLDATTPIQKMWEAYFRVLTSRDLATTIHDRVVDHLVKTHKFTFTADEQAQLDYVIGSFVQFGPGIATRGTATGGGGGGSNLTFADLTGWSTDSTGTVQSFMATEDQFKVVKALHDKNLIVAVSGDFGGPKALRGIGTYMREHGGTLTAFYLSNVEQYLFMDGKQQAFYDNVGTLPINDSSVFIRPYSIRSYQPGLCGVAGFLKRVKAGQIQSNRDAMTCPL